MNIDKRYYINAKLFNKLKEINPDESIDIEVMEVKNKEIYTLLTITGIKNRIEITEFDRCIVDSIFTLYSLGLTEFSFQDLVRTLIISNVEKISQKQINSISQSIEKLRFINLSIDATEEMIKRKNILEDKKYVLNGLMVPVKPTKVKSANNKYVDGYCFVDDSVLFEYAMLVKQVICVEFKFISINLRYSEENVTLLNYIIKRIAQYQNKNNKLLSNKISLERYDKKSKTNKGLYYDLGYLDINGIPIIKTWRDKKTKINKTIVKILDQLCKNGYIQSYVKIKGLNKSINGYELIISNEKVQTPKVKSADTQSKKHRQSS